jgi:hypothetical protein
MSTQGRIAVLVVVVLLALATLACGNLSESSGTLDAIQRTVQY